MEELILNAINGQGVWCILCVCLTLYTLNTTKEREDKLNNIILELTKKFDLMEDVKQDVEEIKTEIFK